MKPLLWLVTLLFVATSAHARTWKNKDGREIEADYLSSDGTTVKLRMNGREVAYQLANLSEEDRAWIAAQVEAPQKVAPAAAAPTGFRGDVPTSERLFPEAAGYFEDKDRKKMLENFKSDPVVLEAQFDPDPDNWFKREDGRDTFQIYVPESYDGTEAYGLYLHISPGDGGDIPDKWRSLFDERKIISVSANGTSNHQPMLRRVVLSMDALQTAEKSYRIDPKRRVVGGLSGGGHMGMLTAAMFPDFFIGAVSHAAQSYLPSEERKVGHFPGLVLRDFKREPRGKIRWVVISGNKDFNYDEILKTSKEWDSARLAYRFIDVPEMGHTTSTAEKLAEAFDWIATP